ncbi:MAG: hypothetical protein M1821_008413 [Bathelium mastoideum]|nr:MAG: hypothetical protein M1821_008413 [Bathelium mastoideum]
MQNEGSGPAITSNFPDPCIIKNGSTWWAFGTESPGTPINIPLASSTDFKTWTVETGDALPNPPEWVNVTAQTLWAPDVNLMDDGSFVMYFSAATTKDPAHHCVGAATSQTLNGPFDPLPSPLFCPLEQGGAIDPSGFKDWDQIGDWTDPGGNYEDTQDRNSWTNPTYSQGGSGGTRYVTYKVDGNSLGNGDVEGYGTCGNTVEPIKSTPIILQPMKADGLTPDGPETTLINNDGLNDAGVTEAPSMVKTPGNRYVLFFSTGCYSGANYSVHYASSDNLTSAYDRHGALFQTGTDNLYAPGGADILWDAQHLVFHGDYPNHDAKSRAMYTAVVDIDDNNLTSLDYLLLGSIMGIPLPDK